MEKKNIKSRPGDGNTHIFRSAALGKFLCFFDKKYATMRPDIPEPTRAIFI